jgi:predicted RNA-binding Zn ribbon-like protein
MSWRLVDGVPVPDAVGNHPALDFCNTRAGWGTSSPKEYLRAPTVLPLWARETGLLSPADLTRPPDADADAALARALLLREALYACALQQGTRADWALVSAEAAHARSVSVLVPGGGAPTEPTPASWQVDPGVGPVGAALALVASAAEDLLTSPLSAVVAACPGEGCGWLFADPRRRRRWCSMAACGNRAKARRYAERRATEA